MVKELGCQIVTQNWTLRLVKNPKTATQIGAEWIFHRSFLIPQTATFCIAIDTNIVTTQIYAKITSQKLDNDLTMLGNKLNASFKNLKMA